MSGERRAGHPRPSLDRLWSRRRAYRRRICSSSFPRTTRTRRGPHRASSFRGAPGARRRSQLVCPTLVDCRRRPVAPGRCRRSPRGPRVRRRSRSPGLAVAPDRLADGADRLLDLDNSSSRTKCTAIHPATGSFAAPVLALRAHVRPVDGSDPRRLIPVNHSTPTMAPEPRNAAPPNSGAVQGRRRSRSGSQIPGHSKRSSCERGTRTAPAAREETARHHPQVRRHKPPAPRRQSRPYGRRRRRRASS